VARISTTWDQDHKLKHLELHGRCCQRRRRRDVGRSTRAGVSTGAGARHRGARRRVVDRLHDVAQQDWDRSHSFDLSDEDCAISKTASRQRWRSLRRQGTTRQLTRHRAGPACACARVALSTAPTVVRVWLVESIRGEAGTRASSLIVGWRRCLHSSARRVPRSRANQRTTHRRRAYARARMPRAGRAPRCLVSCVSRYPWRRSEQPASSMRLRIRQQSSSERRGVATVQSCWGRLQPFRQSSSAPRWRLRRR